MSALDDLIQFVDSEYAETDPDHLITASRAELAELRAQSAALTDLLAVVNQYAVPFAHEWSVIESARIGKEVVAQLYADHMQLQIEYDPLEAQLAVYQRREAMRQ